MIWPLPALFYDMGDPVPKENLLRDPVLAAINGQIFQEMAFPIHTEYPSGSI
jgi:hypothetical protein